MEYFRTKPRLRTFFELGICEAVAVKKQVIKSATEAANLILKIKGQPLATRNRQVQLDLRETHTNEDEIAEVDEDLRARARSRSKTS